MPDTVSDAERPHIRLQALARCAALPSAAVDDQATANVTLINAFIDSYLLGQPPASRAASTARSNAGFHADRSRLAAGEIMSDIGA